MEERMTCPKCKKEFLGRENELKSNTEMETPFIVYKCPDCGFQFQSDKKLEDLV